MATHFVHTANRFYSFFAAEKVVEQQSHVVGAAASRLHLLSADLAALVLRNERAAPSIRKQLSSIMVAISASTQVQHAAIELMLISSHHRLRHSSSLVSTQAQLDAFDSAISRLEKFLQSLESHLELQQQVMDATSRLIQCLQNVDSWEDL
ncbi:hypothetical protein [Paraburkholderia caledonica]|uniref:Ribosome quality control (RQC) complex YloA/Tae2 family protein n=1 Tax=Paraburkholderia caledonica TaxID=134536 RepID=A0AB73IPP4_9BURK|nr:putative ribosome quality control (RQC) complex YloA/Tae2 family protein [Paraburkholderia caledonica]